MSGPILAFTQGDPAGIGPEILIKLLCGPSASAGHRSLLVAERAALAALRGILPDAAWERLVDLDEVPDRAKLESLEPGSVAVLDPVGERRPIPFGRSGAADARGALRALDLGMALARSGAVDALVTAPVSKESIARHERADFRGHTEYLAEGCGLERYGRDYLMAFLAPDLQVALLTVHRPLREALDEITPAAIADALGCLHRHTASRIALAALNPHAGEGGLLGHEEDLILDPGLAAARSSGIDAHGPESADSLFARARRGEFDWVLALYHDQGLIAVKTAAFGLATNWTLGLPFLRTSVDHGTAFSLAGRGRADERPLAAVVETTLKLISKELPKKKNRSALPGPEMSGGAAA